MINTLFEILKLKKIKIVIHDQNTNAALFSFNVWAKPNSKVEKVFVDTLGVLIVQTRSRPLEGEANNSIVEAVSELLGVPKSSIEIMSGVKSRKKRIKVLLEFTAHKKVLFYTKKFNEILVQEASN